MRTCRACGGTGVIREGWNYPAHTCPDCGGTGTELEEGVDYWVCEICEREFDHELEDGICEDCKEEIEQEEKRNNEFMKG